jgi:hypothetical protein
LLNNAWTAGCGKTVLAFVRIPSLPSPELIRSRATIINYFCHDIPFSASSKILYFFCDHRDPTKRSLNDLLCILIKQLLDGDGECLAGIVSWRKEKMPDAASIPKPLSNSEYIDLIRRLCTRWTSIRLVIDAIDECEDLNTFVPGLATLVADSNINLLLTSRHDVDLVRAIEPIAKYRVPMVENMRDDIHQYLVGQVRTRIERGSLKLRDRTLEASIVGELEQKADGM